MADQIDFLEEESGKGFEGVDTNIPRIKILHFTSPEVLPGDEHVENAVAGAFFNTVTKKVYGNSLSVIPIKSIRVWLEWGSKEQGGGFRGRHLPGSIQIVGDIFTGAVTVSGNDVQEAMEIYCLISGEEAQGPVLLSLTGASIRHGKNWMTSIATTMLPSGKPQPFYGSIWKITTALNKNAQGQWYTIGVKNATNAEAVRFINKEEFGSYVKPAVEFCDGLVKSLLAAPKAAEGKALPAPQDSEY